MRILSVSQYFWPERFRINDLAMALKDRGHHVAVLTGLPNYPQGKIFAGYGLFGRRRNELGGITTHRLPMLPRGSGNSLGLFLNYLSFALSGCLLAPLLCRGRYELIFVFEPSPVTVALPALTLKAIHRIPVMLWIQDLWPESVAAAGGMRLSGILAMVKSLVRFIYRRCDRILVQSRAFIPRIVEVGGDERRVRYLPNWAEAVYETTDAGKMSGAPDAWPAGFTVMFAGNLGVAQSLETLVDAASELRNFDDVHWVVMGDGRRREWLEMEIERQRLSSTVHLLGHQPVEQMPSYLAAADVVLVTLSDEPLFSLTVPSKIQSYLASGRPIIGALNGEGARIIAESGAGRSVPAQDARGLARTVREFYRMSSGEREKLGEYGRAYFEEHFGRENLLDDLEIWMQELVIG